MNKQLMKKQIALYSLFLLSFILLTSFGAAPTGYKAGDTAADFTLKNVTGKMVSLADYKTAKGFIVVFTCNHCPFAKMYEDRVIALDQQFAKSGYPVIAISSNDVAIEPDDSYANMVTRAKAKHYSFPYLYDESQQTAHTFGATNTPHVYVLAKDGNNLVVKYVGAIDNSAQDESLATQHYVADAVTSLLAGQPVAVAQTKAIGCGIKWKANTSN